MIQRKAIRPLALTVSFFLMSGCVTVYQRELMVHAQPSGAMVWHNGKSACLAPCTVSDVLWYDSEMQDSVVVRREGYAPARLTPDQLLFVTSGSATWDVVLHRLDQEPTSGSQQQQQMMGPTVVIAGQQPTGAGAVEIKEFGLVVFESVPSGAEIYVDNNLVGSTPTAALRIQAGQHTISMKKAGYQDWTRQMMALANSTITIKGELARRRTP